MIGSRRGEAAGDLQERGRRKGAPSLWVAVDSIEC